MQMKNEVDKIIWTTRPDKDSSYSGFVYHLPVILLNLRYS